MVKNKESFNSNQDLIDGYEKKPRRLSDQMIQALKAGKLKPLLDAVLDEVPEDSPLSLEIRDRRFNIYYGGGSLLRVSREHGEWVAKFDQKYDRQGNLNAAALLQPIGEKSMDGRDSREWVKHFARLKGTMDEFWNRCAKGGGDKKEIAPDRERNHSLLIATANSAGAHNFDNLEFVVLDIEYTWARRSFDMVAARRTEGKSGSEGWINPDLYFIEVKSRKGACYGDSGIADHAVDWACMITAKAPDGSADRAAEFRAEIEEIIGQKKELGLIDSSFDFKGFFKRTPKLLFVLVGEAAREFDSARFRKELEASPSRDLDKLGAALKMVGDEDRGFQVIRITDRDKDFVLSAPVEWLSVGR